MTSLKTHFVLDHRCKAGDLILSCPQTRALSSPRADSPQGDGEAAPSPARPHVCQLTHGPDVLSSASHASFSCPTAPVIRDGSLGGDKGSTQVPAHSHGFQTICVSFNFSYLLLLYVLLFCFFSFQLPAC